MKIGVLALQGFFQEHVWALKRLEVDHVPVRLPDQLVELDGLIIPGGESTAIGKLMERYGFIDRIRDLARIGFPIYGTCAGMILLAGRSQVLEQPLVGVMDIKVKRNAFGRQLESFEELLSVPVLGKEPFKGIFIRAPLIEEMGRNVQVLAELTDDLRMHRYFLQKALRFKRSMIFEASGT